MPLATQRVIETAQLASDLARDQAKLASRIDAFLKYNSHQAIDWAAAVKPDYLPQDAKGNIDGLTFDAQSAADAIFALQQVSNVLNNVEITPGNHLGTLNKIASPY